jgi:hypothetical protein
LEGDADIPATNLPEGRCEEVVRTSKQSQLVYHDPVYHWYLKNAAEMQNRILCLQNVPRKQLPSTSSANFIVKVHTPANRDLPSVSLYFAFVGENIPLSDDIAYEGDDEDNEWNNGGDHGQNVREYQDQNHDGNIGNKEKIQ